MLRSRVQSLLPMHRDHRGQYLRSRRDGDPLDFVSGLGVKENAAVNVPTYCKCKCNEKISKRDLIMINGFNIKKGQRCQNWFKK